MSKQSFKNISKLLDIETKSVPIEEQFLNDLKRSMEIEDKKGWRLPSKTFKPSAMNCRRGSYYQLVGQEPDEGEAVYNIISICNAGSDIHERIQGFVSHMSNSGMDCEWVDVGSFIERRQLLDVSVREKMGYETKLYNNRYNISFMCDGLIKYKGKYYILELKTETSHKWYNRKDVDKKHYHQAISYSISLGIDEVIFVYIDRDMLNMKAYRFVVTDDMKQEVIDYITEVQGYVDRHIVPPKPENIEKRLCQYCGYRQSCRKDG